MFGFIIFLVFGMAIDTCAMEKEKKLTSSGSLTSISDTSGNDDIDAGSGNVTSSTPRLISSKSSRSLSKKHTGSSKKTVKSKKDTYQDQQRNDLLLHMKSNNTQDIMRALHPDVNVADEEGRTLLILAIQKRNEFVINDLCMHKNIDVNRADKWGNTPLHHAFLQQNFVLIKNLLEDCRVNFLLKNEDGSFAWQLLEESGNNTFSGFRNLFFNRVRLEKVIEKIKPTLQEKLHGKSGDAWSDVISDIKERIANDSIAQDEPLPLQMQLPIEDAFIRKLLVCCLARQGMCAVNNVKNS